MKVWAWLKKNWKVVGGFLLLVLGGAAAALAKKPRALPPDPDPGSAQTKDRIREAREKIDDAREVYNIEVAVADTKSAELRGEFKEALATDDASERRERVRAVGRKVGL